MTKVYFLFIILLTLHSGSVFSQSGATPYFTVEGEGIKTLKLGIEDLMKLKQMEVTAKDKDGKDHGYNGVRLFDILVLAGVPLGGELRGKNLAKYILIKANDGYEVIFALPEVDPEFSTDTILLAYQMDGKPLPKGEGPFRVVAPNDKKHARWIRDISTLKIAISKE